MDQGEYEKAQRAHQKNRKILRIVGIVLLCISLPLLITGLVLFFKDFGNPSETDNPFLAMPFMIPGVLLLPPGIFLLVVSFSGQITRYMKNETMPTTKEAMRDIKPELTDLAHGMQNKEAEDTLICPTCGTKNDPGDTFCKKCGSQLNLKKTCPYCGKEIDEDAEFCPKCGKKIK